MRLLLTFVAVLGTGMVLTTAFAGSRASTRGPLAAQRAHVPGHLTRVLSNAPLAARLRPLVPVGLTLDDAAAGFADATRFITALHISRILDLPFAELKDEAVASDTQDLAEAVRALRPGKDDSAALEAAERQARSDLKASGQLVRDPAEKAEN